ncbi:hypothetical protein DTO169E5_807 [Paecilomyces variotii]|nr:hypothetical protein DTO169E5_807 [Paecilomyces variotii]
MQQRSLAVHILGYVGWSEKKAHEKSPSDRFGDKIGTPAITALVRRVLQLALLSSHLFTSPFAQAIDASTFVIL